MTAEWIHGHSGHQPLTREGCRRIVASVFRLQTSGGKTNVSIYGWWNGEMRWGRNRVALASDRSDFWLRIERQFDNTWAGVVETNQYDEVSLRGAVAAAERAAYVTSVRAKPPRLVTGRPLFAYPETTVWSEATSNTVVQDRSRIARDLSEDAEQQGMLAAGYLEMRVGEWATSDTADGLDYGQFTQAQCSMTIRHPNGSASGWAGRSSFDWGTINSGTIARLALEKCMASVDRVRIEPGRYTTILEPQATGDLVNILSYRFARNWMDHGGEHPESPFYLGYDQAIGKHRSKLGLQIIDPRISIDHEVAHPQLGVIPQRGLQSVAWIRNGVLVNLDTAPGGIADRPKYSLPELNMNDPIISRPSFRMSGGDTSIEQMIETTQRGLLVTRFFGLQVLDDPTVLLTGVTRDGLWLIENGKLSKAVHNMRITESPLFVLNQVESLGVPGPIFRPVRSPELNQLTPAVVPPIKVRDFSFTALVDAV